MITGTSSWPWCECQPIKPTVRVKCFTQLGYERGEVYASSLVYRIQPPAAALLYPNYGFLTPRKLFLVRAGTPLPCHPLSVACAHIDHAQSSRCCRWHLAARHVGCQPSHSQRTFFFFLCFFFPCVLRRHELPRLIAFNGWQLSGWVGVQMDS